MQQEELKKIPGIDILLNHPVITSHLKSYGSNLTKYVVRNIVNKIRLSVLNGNLVPEPEEIVGMVTDSINSLTEKTLKSVINATGIILHTNLGRSPIGKELFEDVIPLISGYTNLELDLQTGKRGKRGNHIIESLRYLTEAEDALVVNNNAAAVSLILRAFADKKEVIVSRGELVEIGGSFRLPDIMKASGVKIVEVGTTNRTRIEDYENAVTKNTRIILKAYRSNYTITGFTEEASTSELAAVSKKHNLIFVNDIGSGNFGSLNIDPLKIEPSISKELKAGADLITFSCDKLMGGPQAGIIAGKTNLITRLDKHPLMRTYRVDKITLALLAATIRIIILNKDLTQKLPIYYLFSRPTSELKSLAEKLKNEFYLKGIESVITDSEGSCGGGALPDYKFKSFTVKLSKPKGKKEFAQNIFYNLLTCDKPVMGILRKGNIYFDVLALFEEEIHVLSESVKSVYE